MLLMEPSWFRVSISCEMSKYIALIIDNLNHDASLSELLNPVGRIHRLLDKYKRGEVIE